MSINDEYTVNHGSKGRGHLIEPVEPVSQPDAARQLTDVHDFLVARTRASLSALAGSAGHSAGWGCWAKRATVDLGGTVRPELVGKLSERIIEVINMTATLERLLDVLRWFQAQRETRDWWVLECHPSTSSTAEGNDLVLGLADGKILARCEVTDVVSSFAGQNKKELRDLKSLRCADGVPDDGVRRFICTSRNFGEALSAPGRPWPTYRYCYHGHCIDETMLLEVKARPILTPAAGLPDGIVAVSV